MTTIFSVRYSGLEHGESFIGRIFSFTETCPEKMIELFEDEYRFCVEAKTKIENTFDNVLVRSIQPTHCVQ